MRVNVSTVGDFSKTIGRLNKMAKTSPNKALQQIAKEGTSALSAGTPVGETGQTAMGWKDKVTDNEIQWANNAHPGESVNIAKIIQLGHGTGTGGYVPPNDYIRPALTPIFGKAADIIAKELFD